MRRFAPSACFFKFLAALAAVALFHTQTVSAVEVRMKMIDFGSCPVVRQLGTDFTALNPGITINVTCDYNWHPDFSADLARNQPLWDLHVIDGAWFGEADEADGLEDLTDWRQANLQYGDFFEQASKAYGEYPPNSKRYSGLPFNLDMFALLYSKSAFARYNLSLPASVEEMVERAEFFKAQGLRAGFQFSTCVDYDICGVNANLRFLAGTLIRSYGGSTWDSTTYKIKGVVDSEQNYEAIRTLKRLIATGSNTTDYFASFGELCSGTQAMLGTFLSMMPSMMTYCPDLAMYAFPYSDSRNSDGLFLGGMGLTLMKQSLVKTEALLFMKHLMSRTAQRKMAASGAFTIRKSVATDPNFVFDSNNNLLKQNIVFIQSASRGIPDCNLPVAPQLVTLEEIYYSKIVNGRMTVEDGMRALAAEQQAVMDAKYPCGPKCPIPYKRNEGVFKALFAICLIVIAAFIGLGVSLFVLRNEAMMKASSLPFMWFTVLGGIAMEVSFALEYPESPSDSTCLAVNWVRLLGMALLFGALVAKTYRIAAIFGMKRINKVKITNELLFKYFGVIVLAFVGFLAAWTAVDPPKAELKLTPLSSGDTSSYPTCSGGSFNNYSALLEVLLLLCASVLAFQVRNAPSGFHEAKYMALGIYNWVIVTGICFLVSNSVSDYNVLFAFDGLRVLLTAPVILGLLFVPKFIAIKEGIDPQNYSNTDASKLGSGQMPPNSHYSTGKPETSKMQSSTVPAKRDSPVATPRGSVRTHTLAHHATSARTATGGEYPQNLSVNTASDGTQLPGRPQTQTPTGPGAGDCATQPTSRIQVTVVGQETEMSGIVPASV